MHCILYARSRADDKRKEDAHLRQQLFRLRRFAKRQGWPILAEFIDKGESALNLKRAGYQDLLKFCKAEKEGIKVVVTGPDRLFRSLRDCLEFQEKFWRRPVRLVSLEHERAASEQGLSLSDNDLLITYGYR